MMNNAYYFMLKTRFVSIFTFLSWSFGYVEKWIDKKALVNFKIYDVLDWIKDNDNTYFPISLHVKAIRQWDLERWNNITRGTFFLETSYTKCDEEISLRPFHKRWNLRIFLGQQSKMW